MGSGLLHFNALAGVTPCEYPDKLLLPLQKLEWLSYWTLKTARSYFHSSGQNTGIWWTGGQTDRQTARWLLQWSALRAMQKRCKNLTSKLVFGQLHTVHCNCRITYCGKSSTHCVEIHLLTVCVASEGWYGSESKVRGATYFLGVATTPKHNRNPSLSYKL